MEKESSRAKNAARRKSGAAGRAQDFALDPQRDTGFMQELDDETGGPDSMPFATAEAVPVGEYYSTSKGISNIDSSMAAKKQQYQQARGGGSNISPNTKKDKSKGSGAKIPPMLFEQGRASSKRWQRETKWVTISRAIGTAPRAVCCGSLHTFEGGENRSSTCFCA